MFQHLALYCNGTLHRDNAMVGEIDRALISSLVHMNLGLCDPAAHTSSVSVGLAGSLGWRDPSLWPSEMDHFLKWKRRWKGIERHFHMVSKREGFVLSQQTNLWISDILFVYTKIFWFRHEDWLVTAQ